MRLDQFERDVRDYYKKLSAKELEAKIESLIEHTLSEWRLEKKQLTHAQLRIIANSVIDIETQKENDRLQELLAQKERIERQIEREREVLQERKYHIFDTLEAELENSSELVRSILAQIKLQSLDLYDMLEEMSESAIITTLEKSQDIEETIKEVIKEITFETLSEGVMSASRTKKVVTTILTSAINIAEASPNNAKTILRATMHGLKLGLIRSLSRLKKQLLYMSDELKAELLIEDEPLKVDLLFTQVVEEIRVQSSQNTATILDEINNEFDMSEFIELSKETMDALKERIKSSKMLNSKTAQEAKRMGISAWSAVESAIKNAKEKIEKI